MTENDHSKWMLRGSPQCFRDCLRLKGGVVVSVLRDNEVRSKYDLFLASQLLLHQFSHRIQVSFLMGEI